MARDQDRRVNDHTGEGPEGEGFASIRRAVLRALAGVPVILTLSSELARAGDSIPASSPDRPSCIVPREDPPPDMPEDCPSPPPQ